MCVCPDFAFAKESVEKNCTPIWSLKAELQVRGLSYLLLVFAKPFLLTGCKKKTRFLWVSLGYGGESSGRSKDIQVFSQGRYCI